MSKTRLVSDSANENSIDGVRLADRTVPFDKLIGEAINVEDFGAIPDIVDRNDGIITAGSWTFQTPTSCFSADDVGKILVFCGAYNDPDNKPGYGPAWYSVSDNVLICTITGYNSATSVIISPQKLSGVAPPTPDRSLDGISFYFGTNNRDAFRNAIDHAHSIFLSTGRPQGVYAPGKYGVGGPGNTVQLVWLKSGVTVFGDSPNSSIMYGMNVYGGPFGIGNGITQGRVAAASDGGPVPTGGFRPWKIVTSPILYGDSSITMNSVEDAEYIGVGIKLLRSQAFLRGFPEATQLVKVVRVEGLVLHLEKPLQRDFGPSYIDKEQATAGPVQEAPDFFVEKAGLDSVQIKNLRLKPCLSTYGLYDGIVHNCIFTGGVGIATNSFNVFMTNCVINAVVPSNEFKIGTFNGVIDGLVFNQIEPPKGYNISRSVASGTSRFQLPFFDCGEFISGIDISNVVVNFPGSVTTETQGPLIPGGIISASGCLDAKFSDFKVNLDKILNVIFTSEVAWQDSSRFSQTFENISIDVKEITGGEGFITVRTGFVYPYPRKHLRFINVNVNDDAITPLSVKFNTTNNAEGFLVNGVRGPGTFSLRWVGGGTPTGVQDYGLITNGLFTKFEVSDSQTGIKNQRVTFANNNRYGLATYFGLSYLVQDWVRTGTIAIFPESSDYSTNSSALWRSIVIPAYPHLMDYYDKIEWSISGFISAGSVVGKDCHVVVEYDFGGAGTRTQDFLVAQNTGEGFVLRNSFWKGGSSFIAQGELSSSAGSDAKFSDITFDWVSDDFTINVYTYSVAPSNSATTYGSMRGSEMKINFFGL